MTLGIVQKPVKLSFSIANLAQSSCVDANKNADAVIVSRYRITETQQPCAPIRKQEQLARVYPQTEENTVTPIKLQARVQPLTSTPIPFGQSKRKRAVDSIYSEDSSQECPFNSPGSSIDENDERPSKKSRPMFENRQIIELERYFLKHKYLLIEDRPVLAKRLGLSQQQIKTWFQNRRMKEKRQNKTGPSRYLQKKNELCNSAQSAPIDISTTALTTVGFQAPEEPPVNDSHQQFFISSKAVFDQLSYMYNYGAMSPVLFPGPSSQPYNGLSPQPSDSNRM